MTAYRIIPRTNMQADKQRVEHLLSFLPVSTQLRILTDEKDNRLIIPADTIQALVAANSCKRTNWKKYMCNHLSQNLI